MVSNTLLEVLACPSCKGDLEYDEKADTLTCNAKHCSACGMPVNDKGVCTDSECGQHNDAFVSLRYRVQDNIPIMLIPEAEKIPHS